MSLVILSLKQMTIIGIVPHIRIIITTLNLSSSSCIVCEQLSRLVTVTTVTLPCHGTKMLV